MTEVWPDFYDRFLCRAGDCRHSCCRGWEIDVDGDTAARYRAMPGPLGEALRSAMEDNGEVCSFRLTEAGSCPMLCRDGLCRVILEAGEDALCDICALHPRFFSDVGDYALDGLGLSCEAVCSLLLEAPELRFCTDEDEDLSLEGLLLRLGLHLLEERLHFVPTLDEEYYVNLLKVYKDCEPIDDDWAAECAALNTARADLMPRLIDRYADFPDRIWDRIYGYVLYRQLERAPEVGITALADYARDACSFILLRTLLWQDLPEQLRRWSEEIEYSTENVDRLLRFVTA